MRRSHQPNPRRRKSPSSGGPTRGERLQKVLAAAGLGSRRQCEELIQTGRVEVDRQVVTEMGTRVDVGAQEICVDGSPLPRQKRVYYAVNKPVGVLSTNRDPSGRPRVVDLIPPSSAFLYTVGRLDVHSDGLILVTNDGELANRLTHPRYGVPKTYRVLVAGQPPREVLDKLRQGVHLAEGVARVSELRPVKQQRQSTLLEMVLQEGHNREIRRIMARVGHKVLRLTRIAVGPIRLGKLTTGAYRRLTHEEVEALKKCSHHDRPSGPAAKR